MQHFLARRLGGSGHGLFALRKRGSAVAVAIALSFTHANVLAAEFTPLGFISPTTTPRSSTVVGISADGSTVFGVSTNSNGVLSWNEAFRWSGSGPMQGLGVLDNTDRSSFAYSASDDGSVIVGSSTVRPFGSTIEEAFRWTASGMEALGFLSAAPSQSTALDVSADGTVIAGTSKNDYGPDLYDEAYRWTAGPGMEGLGFLSATSSGFRQSVAYAIAADGSTIVGRSTDIVGGQNVLEMAVRWTGGAGSIESLGTLNLVTNPFSYYFSIATHVSRDGAVIAGMSSNNNADWAWDEGFVWSGGTMTGIGVLAPSVGYSYGNSAVLGLSADGGVVIGNSTNNNGSTTWHQAVTWTTSDLLQPLPALADPAAIDTVFDQVNMARAVSADGGVIVGSSYELDGATYVSQAVVWDAARSVFAIRDLVEAGGGDLTGWTLQSANAVSADGDVIAGDGVDPDGHAQAWIYRSGAIITPDVVAASFAELSDMAQKETAAVNAAVGLELLLAGKQCGDAADWGDKRYCFFGRGTGTLSDDDASSADVSLGVAMRLRDDFTVGVSLQLGAGSSDLADGGFYDARSAGLTAFAAYAPQTGFQASGAIAFGGSSFDVTRDYFNANTPVSSYGETEGGTVAATVKLGWRFPVTAELALTPFASYSASRFHADGWTESGGPFPAVIEPIEQTSQVIRVGVEGQLVLDPATKLWASAAIAHRFESHGAAVSGEIVGVTSATTSGVSLEQDWAEVAIGADYALDTDTTLSAAVGANSLGGFSATIGYSVKF